MQQQLLASLYPFVKEFEFYSDAPISIAILTKGFSFSEIKVVPEFAEMIKNKLIIKKYSGLNIYMLTEKGWNAIKDAYTCQTGNYV
jgi:hypothetical protein